MVSLIFHSSYSSTLHPTYFISLQDKVSSKKRKEVPFSTHLSHSVLILHPTGTIKGSRWNRVSGRVSCSLWGCAHLFGVVPREAELARSLAPSIFAAIEVHAPGTTEGERGTTGIWVFALASAGTAATYITC